MQSLPILFVERIPCICWNERNLGAVGEIRRLIQNQPAIMNFRFEWAHVVSLSRHHSEGQRPLF